MTDMQAALGLVQLKKIEKNWKSRKKVWDYYNVNLKDLPIQIPTKIPNNISPIRLLA